jgi:hypothetical protein
MALQKDYYDKRLEVIKSNCYWKISPTDDGINGGKESLRVRVLCYKDKATADINSREYSGYNFEFTPDLESADNFIAQAYIYLKTLPAFSTATDV